MRQVLDGMAENLQRVTGLLSNMTAALAIRDRDAQRNSVNGNFCSSCCAR